MANSSSPRMTSAHQGEILENPLQVSLRNRFGSDPRVFGSNSHNILKCPNENKQEFACLPPPLNFQELLSS